MKILIFLCAALALPDICFAWGFETHISIGLNILQNTSMDILKNNQAHFLCGNIFPDLFNLFKDFSSFKKNLATHSWATVSKMFENSKTDAQRAFCYGYSSHLSADIIAHNHMVPQQLAYVNGGRMRSHLILEMAEEAMHNNKYNRTLMKLLKNCPDNGDIFLDTMHIKKEWFVREVYTIRLAVMSQKNLRMHSVSRMIKKIVEPNFQERCEYFRDAAIENASRAVEEGFENFMDEDPSGKENMAKAREMRKRMLKASTGRAMKKEFKSRLDQKFFPLMKYEKE